MRGVTVGMREMMGMRAIMVEMRGIRVGMWEIRVEMQGIGVEMRGIGGGNVERDKNKKK